MKPRGQIRWKSKKNIKFCAHPLARRASLPQVYCSNRHHMTISLKSRRVSCPLQSCFEVLGRQPKFRCLRASTKLNRLIHREEGHIFPKLAAYTMPASRFHAGAYRRRSVISATVRSTAVSKHASPVDLLHFCAYPDVTTFALQSFENCH